MKPIHIFRAGPVKDNKGNEYNITEAHLANLAATWPSQAMPDAPLTIGHYDPKNTKAPAYGWVNKLIAKGKDLFAVPNHVVPQFSKWVEDKIYKNVSAAFYYNKATHEPTGLNHVAFLGAVPPAIPGLEPIQFSAAPEGGDTIVIEFSGWQEANAFNMIGDVLGNLRDFFIEKFGLEKADQVAPSFTVDRLKAITPTDELDTSASLPAFSAATDTTIFSEGQPMTKEEQAAFDALKTSATAQETRIAEFSGQVETLTAKVTALETENGTLKAAATSQEKENRTIEFSRFVDTLIAAGKLAPKNKDATVARLEREHQAGCTIEFSADLPTVAAAQAGGSASGKTKPVDEYKAELEALPVILEFSERATKEKMAGAAVDANDPVAIARKATEYKNSQEASGNIISFSQAVAEVMKS